MRVGAYERAAMLSELQDENFRLAARLEAQSSIAKMALEAAVKHAEEVMRLRGLIEDVLLDACDPCGDSVLSEPLTARLSAELLRSPLGQGVVTGESPVEGVARAEVVATPGTPGGGALGGHNGE